MNDEIKKAVQKSQTVLQEAHPKERAAFKPLLLSNPNYFGNLAESMFTPILPICCNTHYESLGCVGYHPQQEYLEAVVYIYQPSGYGSDICGSGSTEYVRFYLSFDNGATWDDQGMTSFQAHNIPEGTDGGKRLEYAASLKVDPQRKLCFFNHLILVRAILSWNNPPPANQPNWKPVWGNVRQETIQVEPRRWFLGAKDFVAAKVKLPPNIEEMLDLEKPIPTKMKSLGTADLSALYKGKGVPVHRFAFKELSAFASGQTMLSAEAFTKLLPGIQINPDINDLLFPKTDGDTSFEELKCIGLDPNFPDTLVGVIQIKKSSGFSGGPCTDGSREYVTFWADFDGNGSLETCLGTASVRVYDLANIPPEGVYYAVRLPVDLSQYRQNCKKGPRVVRIRAILSWNAAVPCANPSQVPTWGNREETLINIAPSSLAPAGKIAILGGIPTGEIHNVTGLTTPNAAFIGQPPGSPGGSCPFAGIVTVQGTPIVGYSYVVEVSEDGLLWTPVLTELDVTDQNGDSYPDIPKHKANPVTKRFDYLSSNKNVTNLLAQWGTTGDAKWYVRLSTYDGGGTLQGTDTHVIQLDNTWPEASIDITIGAGNCGKFQVGTVLSGNFIARDDHLGSYSLGVEPAVNDPGEAIPSPSSGLVQTAPAPGDAWTLDTGALVATGGMKPCGYVIRVVVVDRAIIDSRWVGHVSSDSAGFCLEEPIEG